jgi:hypothetical protein
MLEPLRNRIESNSDEYAVHRRLILSSCQKLPKLEFATPASLKDITRSCFQKCGLVAVHFLNLIETLHQAAFSGCRALTNLTFEEQSKFLKIEEDCLQNCQLTEITPPPDACYESAVDESVEVLHTDSSSKQDNISGANDRADCDHHFWRSFHRLLSIEIRGLNHSS